MKKTFGIIAHPVDHSLSPPMQQAAFDALGIDAEFLRFDVSPEELPDFIEKMHAEKISGCAVSLPNKEEILPYLDEMTTEAKAIGAVNTLFWKDGKLCGTNTDAPGFFAAVESSIGIIPSDSGQTGMTFSVAIIGAGGAARAMIYALKNAGMEVTIFNRTVEKAQQLAGEFDIRCESIEEFMAKNFSLVCNATSVGLKEEKSPVPESSWENFSGTAFDAVFSPLHTLFLRDAKKNGANIITGETMLLEQGVHQFELWTKKKAPRESMNGALQKAIQAV